MQTYEVYAQSADQIIKDYICKEQKARCDSPYAKCPEGCPFNWWGKCEKGIMRIKVVDDDGR